MTSTPASLFGPAPGPVAPAVLAAQSMPLVDPTGPEFSRIFTDTASGIGALCGAPGYRVLIQNASASAALEAALLNLTLAGDHVVVAVNGQLSARLARIARAVDLDVSTLELPWGAGLTDPVALRALVRDRTQLVLAVHHETSTGVVIDPTVLADAVHGTSAMVVLDVVASIGVLPLRCADWPVDVAVASSQKGLGATPGLGISVVSPQAMNRVSERRSRTFALDWPRFAEGFDKGRPGSVFTPAISLVSGLNVAVNDLLAEDIDVRAKRYAALRTHLVTALTARGFALLVSELPANSAPVVVMRPPVGIRSMDLVAALAARGVTIGGGQGELRGEVLRFGLFGQTIDTIERLIGLIDDSTEETPE